MEEGGFFGDVASHAIDILENFLSVCDESFSENFWEDSVVSKSGSHTYRESE